MVYPYTIRKYCKGDEEQIIDLLDLVFDGWPKVDLMCSKLDHWKWKYEDRPVKGLIAAVALDGSKVIGCLHGEYVSLKLGGEIYFCEPGGDLAVHPDYRGRKVWRSMVDKWNEEEWSPTIIGYSNSSTPVVVKRAKATNAPMLPSPLIHYCRIRDIDEFLRAKDIPNSMVKKMGYIGLSGFVKVLNMGRIKSSNRSEIRSIQEFDDRFDALWDRVKEDYDLIVKRSSEYLNWRYCDQRGGKYVVKAAKQDEEYLGYIVYRINRYNPNYPEGYIVDLVVMRDDEETALELIADACDYFDNMNVDAIHYWVPRDHFYSNLVGRFGFLNSRNEVVVWFGKSGDPELLDQLPKLQKNKVFFQLGDVDWV